MNNVIEIEATVLPAGDGPAVELKPEPTPRAQSPAAKTQLTNKQRVMAAVLGFVVTMVFLKFTPRR